MDRRHPIVAFDAQQFIEFFGDLASDLDVKLLTGGASNSNYLVRTSKGEQYVCRIHARGNPFVEKSVVARLRGIVPAPEYLWIGEGASVIEFIEGSHFQPSARLMREAGQVLGQLKEISFEKSGQLLPNGEVAPFKGWGSFEEGLSGLLAQEPVENLLGKNSITKLQDLLVQHRGTLEDFDSCHNLVHGDFRPDNILVSGDKITGIIDWEFAHSGCSYMDIGNLLRHASSEREQDFATGLREGGFELPSDWRFRALLMDLASHLEFLTSGRSSDFKLKCVARIDALLKANAEQTQDT